MMHIFMLCILPTMVGQFKNILYSPNSHTSFSLSFMTTMVWLLISGVISQWSCKWVQRAEHPQAARYQASSLARSRADLRWLCQPGWRCPAVCLCSVCCAVWVHITQISIHTTLISCEVGFVQCLYTQHSYLVYSVCCVVYCIHTTQHSVCSVCCSYCLGCKLYTYKNKL